MRHHKLFPKAFCLTLIVVLAGCDYSVQSNRKIKIDDIPNKQVFKTLYSDEEFDTYMKRKTIRESDSADILATSLAERYSDNYSLLGEFLQGDLHDSDRIKVLIVLEIIGVSTDQLLIGEDILEIMTREKEKMEYDAFSMFKVRNAKNNIEERIKVLKAE